MRAITAPKSTSTDPTRIPNSPARRTSSAISAALTRAFVGMHPRVIQVPPTSPRSNSATRRPRLRAARTPAQPPIPAPITATSTRSRRATLRSSLARVQEGSQLLRLRQRADGVPLERASVPLDELHLMAPQAAAAAEGSCEQPEGVQASPDDRARKPLALDKRHEQAATVDPHQLGRTPDRDAVDQDLRHRHRTGQLTQPTAEAGQAVAAHLAERDSALAEQRPRPLAAHAA